MLGYKKSENLVNDIQDKLPDWQTRLTSFIYLISVFGASILYFFGTRTISFHLSLFLVGVTLEYFLWIGVWHSYKQNKIKRIEFNRYTYLVYTVLGLPFTIYLTQSYGHGILAFLRLQSVLILLLNLLPRAAVIWHISFFFCGFFLYQILQSETGIGKDEFFFILSHSVGLFLVWHREKWAHTIQKKILSYYAEKKKLERKNKKLKDVVSKIITSMGSFQRVERYMEEGTKCNSGTYLLVALFCSDMDKSFWHIQKNIHNSRDMAIDLFQREWEMFLDYTRKMISSLYTDMELSIHSDGLMFGHRLVSENDEKIVKGGFSIYQKEKIFHTFFSLQELLRFARETQSSMENRGHIGWHTSILLGLGFVTAMPSNCNNPLLTFRGPLAEEIKKSHLSIEREMRAQDVPIHTLQDRVWIQPNLDTLFKSRFDTITSPVCGGWNSPEFLLSQYTNDRSSLKPNSEFWASLALGQS